jgi:hypothetical protein
VYVGADGDWNTCEGKDEDDAMAAWGMESDAETSTSSDMNTSNLFQSEGEFTTSVVRWSFQPLDAQGLIGWNEYLARNATVPTGR